MAARTLLTVALTGNVASGKSTVARRWAERSLPVLDADQLSREAVRPGSEGLEEVVREFGGEVLDETGALDRSRMRDLVFRDPAARERLERIIHPRVERMRTEWLDLLRFESVPVACIQIPLLFEVGLETAFDVIVFVDASEEVRIDRLVRDRGIDPEEARRIVDSQMDPASKREASDYVIVNDGELRELYEEADRVLAAIRGRVEGLA